jgi:hypothetical protein
MAEVSTDLGINYKTLGNWVPVGRDGGAFWKSDKSNMIGVGSVMCEID